MIWDKLLELIFSNNNKCSFCTSIVEKDDLVCANCLELINRWRAQRFCPICGKVLLSNYKYECEKHEEKIFYNKLIAVTPYQGVFKHAIHKLKYQGKTYLAVAMGRLMASELDRISKIDENFQGAIVPIPVSSRKLAIRGYNQSLLLAKEMNKVCNLKIYDDLLIKVKETEAQAVLKKEKRIENLTNVFSVNPSYKNKFDKVILIDDIITTGTTINRAAEVLLKSGIKEVIAIVWSMTAGKNIRFKKM